MRTPTLCMNNWKQHAIQLRKESDFLAFLESILNTEINDPTEYSEFFKFLSSCVGTNTAKTLPLVVERILGEWRLNGNMNEKKKEEISLLFRASTSFLIRLKQNIRKEYFKSQLFPIWTVIFSLHVSVEDEYSKLILLREYCRELPFHWLFEYILQRVDKDNSTVTVTDTAGQFNFFYSVNLNEFELDHKSVAVIDILIEMLAKAKREHSEDVESDVRVSGLLEKIGSLWRADALLNPLYKGKMLKLLALASLISGSANTIFDSLTGLLDRISSVEFFNVSPSSNIWLYRLVESILRKFSVRQYVLSKSRAELSQISRQVVRIATEALQGPQDKSVCALFKRVLERWDSLTDCPAEVEADFVENVEKFLNFSYKQMVVINFDENNLKFEDEMFSVLVKHFIIPFKTRLLAQFFRNALKQQSSLPSYDSVNLNRLAELLVDDGATDESFKKLFINFPSLVADIHNLITKLDSIYSEKESDAQLASSKWLLLLAESPRTRGVLINFLIDPDQVTFQLKSDTFWMDFFSKIVPVDPVEILNWTPGGKLIEEFYERIFRLNHIRESSESILIKNLFILESFRKDEKFPEIMRISKDENPQLFSWILTNLSSDSFSFPISMKILLDLTPFGDEKLAKKVVSLIGNDLKRPCELIEEIFRSEPLIESINQWNLLAESKTLKYSIDQDLIDPPSRDYGDYLQVLFEQVSNESDSIIKESQDIIEMYLEYNKYGHISSMRVIQVELLRRYRRVELLTKLPLAILHCGGIDFGGTVLDDILENGVCLADLEIIKRTRSDILAEIKDYYKRRLEEDVL